MRTWKRSSEAILRTSGFKAATSSRSRRKLQNSLPTGSIASSPLSSISGLALTFPSNKCRLLKKTHMLRCAQSTRSKGTVQAVQHVQTVQNVEEHEPRTRITTTARLASEIFLSSLQCGFLSNLLAKHI